MIVGKNSSSELVKTPTKNFKHRRGDTFTYTFDAVQINSSGNEEAYDFTDCTLRSSIKKRKTDSKPLTGFGVTTSGNTVTLTLPAGSTQSMEPGEYYWDLALLDANGRHTTLLTGNLQLTYDVTGFFETIKKFYDKIIGNNPPSPNSPAFSDQSSYSPAHDSGLSIFSILEMVIIAFKKSDTVAVFSTIISLVIEKMKIYAFTNNAIQTVIEIIALISKRNDFSYGIGTEIYMSRFKSKIYNNSIETLIYFT